jgi:hypothetical protein
MTPADAQPVLRSISNSLVISQSRCEGSLYCTPAKKRLIVLSISAAPMDGVSEAAGTCIPAVIRPISIA